MPVLRNFVDSLRVNLALPKVLRHWGVVAALAALSCTAVPLLAADAGVQFNRDIRPILSDNCTACHGPDAHARKAGLRLDTKDGIFEKTPKREPAVVPGHPERSELWKHVSSTDPMRSCPRRIRTRHSSPSKRSCSGNGFSPGRRGRGIGLISSRSGGRC